jgi:hypothetical protein
LGVLAKGITERFITFDCALSHPLPSVKVAQKLPLLFTVMVPVVAPVFHVMPAEGNTDKFTEVPLQKLLMPPLLTTGAGGFAFTVTVTGKDSGLSQPFASMICTLCEPELLT